MDNKEFTEAFVMALKDPSVIRGLKEAVCNDLQREVQELRSLLVTRDHKIEQLEKQVRSLESAADQQEQYSRRNSLRISGIAEDENQTSEQIALKLIKDDLGLDMDASSLDRVHRVGKISSDRKSPRPILVKFSTYRQRHNVFKKKNLLKGRAVYINEDLTKYRAKLLYTARKLKKDRAISDCWTHDGQILVKTTHGLIQPINDETELQRYK